MRETGKIDYVEMPSRDIAVTKAFFTAAFGWSFVDYGPAYVAIEEAGIDGGFYASDTVATTKGGSVLVVLYSTSLEETVAKVKSAGGKVIRDISPFREAKDFTFWIPMAMNMRFGRTAIHKRLLANHPDGGYLPSVLSSPNHPRGSITLKKNLLAFLFCHRVGYALCVGPLHRYLSRILRGRT